MEDAVNEVDNTNQIIDIDETLSISLILNFILSVANSNLTGLLFYISYLLLRYVDKKTMIMDQYGQCFGYLVTALIGFVIIVFLKLDLFIILFSLGILLILLPIFFNGGAMPLLKSADRKLNPLRSYFNPDEHFTTMRGNVYCYIGPKTKLSILGDIFYIKKLRVIVCIGDVFLYTAPIVGLIDQALILFNFKPA